MSVQSYRWILGSGLLACAGWGAGARIEHAPKEGAVLTQTFDGTLELRLEELRYMIDGKEFGDPAWVPQIELEERRRTAVIDRFVEMSPAGPLELHRTFEELRNHEERSGIAESGEYESESRLEGETAVFTWLAAQQVYRVEIPSDARIEPELRDALSPVGDLEGFLPPSEVSPGERWLVDARSLARLYGPGGTAGAVESKMREMVDFPRLLAALEGDLEMRFVGTQIDEGRELAALELSRRGEAKLKLDSSYEEGVSYVAFYYPPGTEQWTEETVMNAKVDGTLLWDLRGRHAHSLALETELELERSFELVLPELMPGTISVQERWTGRFAVQLTVTKE